MRVAHKIALDPNLAPQQYFARAAGTARFAYNWALAEWQRQHKAGEKPNDTALRRQLNAIKRAQFPWMFDVTKCAAQEAMIDISAVLSGLFLTSVDALRDSSARMASLPSVQPTRLGGFVPMRSTSSCQSSAGCGCAKPSVSPVF